MELSYLGHSCFLLKDKSFKLLTDPFGKSVGFSQKKQEVDIVTVSHEHSDHNDFSQVAGEYRVINGPGEYEIKGFSVEGIKTYHDQVQGKERGQNVIYSIDVDETRIVHLGDLGHELSEKVVDKLDGVDVLLIPVGGFYTIDAKQAVKIVKQISPSIVIPMHFKTKDYKGKDFEKLTGVEEFVNEMGIEPKKTVKLKIKKAELPEEMELIILERSA